MELIHPSVAYKRSFIEAVKEYKAGEDIPASRRYRELSLADLESHFPDFAAKEISHSRGENLPGGYVPQTDFWLVENGEYIGHVNIRHTLNEHLKQIGGHIGYNVRPSKRGQGYGKQLLALALIEAKKMGIEKVLMTCDIDNIPSGKVIQANGGVLENKVSNPETGVEKARYWIEVK